MTYLTRSVHAVLLTSLLLLSMPFSASAADDDHAGQSNTVNLTIRGGDATALATCLNIAKEQVHDQYQGNWWDHYRNAKRQEEDRLQQENDCANKAVATGGTVVLRNVDITTVQENKGGGLHPPSQSNTVNLTISGGNATALATCLNIAKEQVRDEHRGNWWENRRRYAKRQDEDRLQQENDCDNKAVATGGNVILKNVDITVIQTNTV